MSEEVEDTPPHQSGICQNLQNRVWLKPLSPSSLPSLSSQIKYPFFFFFLENSSLVSSLQDLPQ